MRLSRLIIMAQAHLRIKGDGEIHLCVESPDHEEMETFPNTNYGFDSSIHAGEVTHRLKACIWYDEELPSEKIEGSEPIEVDWSHAAMTRGLEIEISETPTKESETYIPEKPARPSDHLGINEVGLGIIQGTDIGEGSRTIVQTEDGQEVEIVDNETGKALTLNEVDEVIKEIQETEPQA